MSIGLGLSSVDNGFSFIGYISGSGISFQVKFGYELLIIIDRVNVRFGSDMTRLVTIRFG